MLEAMVMRFSRLALAHLVAFGLVGCADSHGRGATERDGGPVDAAILLHDAQVGPDASLVLDGGARVSCDPADARQALCVDIVCDGLPTWHWNGDSCFAIDCGTCEGADCDRGFRSQGECQAAHAACDAALCESTGGEWLWWAEECGHFECGFPPPEVCIRGMPVCDCGDERRFEPGVGCVIAGCPEVDPLPPDVLCAETGGEWGPFCVHSQCGEQSELACAALACHCPGVTQVFDSLRGCVDGTRCFERNPGERCHERARCGGGTICCDQCGGAGCAGEPTCVAPTCDDDPSVDTCGNRRDAP
ncbi:Tryptophan synthase alpha chain [Sandaracinus amylolyticus]|uniref:Tryptophan synthase alpha chain n=2 Tax=Sandaracinus amylolyticus TaxID=927083 RepID=A0A0F6W9D2_9BACT|nr:Tryptophan synthase alpha chain [Sandaracinus amylolyticus]